MIKTTHLAGENGTLTELLSKTSKDLTQEIRLKDERIATLTDQLSTCESRLHPEPTAESEPNAPLHELTVEEVDEFLRNRNICTLVPCLTFLGPDQRSFIHSPAQDPLSLPSSARMS